MLNHNYNLQGYGLDLKNNGSPFDPNRIETITLGQLYGTAFETKPAIVKGLLYPGLYILAGDPKIGKSFFVSQLAFYVATGKDFWNMKVQQHLSGKYAVYKDNQKVWHR